MIFPCRKCGLCCKHLELIPQLKHLDSGKGRCINLNDDNLCAIYENRPDICNVEEMYKLVFSEQMTEEEYIKVNVEGCKVVRNMFGGGR